MLIKFIPNFTLLSNSEMILFLISFVFATAAGVTAFLLFSSGTLSNLKNGFPAKQFPIAMANGKLVTSKEELENHLETLEKKLLKKANELETSRNEVNNAKESIDKLANTTVQIKKYYLKLKDEIKKSEEEFKKIQTQIDDYRIRRIEIEQEIKKSEEHYDSLLNAVNKNSNNNIYSYATITDQSQEGLADKVDSVNGKVPIRTQGLSDPLKEINHHSSLPLAAKTPLNILNKFNICTIKTLNDINNTGSTNDLLVATKPGFSLPKQNMKQLKDRFSSSSGLCCCGSILCTGNCSVTKNLKLDMHFQHHLLQGIAPQCSEIVGRSLNTGTSKVGVGVQEKIFQTSTEELK